MAVAVLKPKGVNGSDSSSPSPPHSPPSPRRQLNTPLLRRRSLSKSLSRPLAGMLLRRYLRYLVVLPLFYFSGLLMCVGSFSAFLRSATPPGSVYRSHELFQKLWHDIEAGNQTKIELSSVWKQKRRPKALKPCPNTTAALHLDHEVSGFSGYLIVSANGGLNQQRAAICNAVAVAGLLNAKLVIPHFEFHGVWKDSSEFGDIYDKEHFIETLKGHVEVVRMLPEELMKAFNYSMDNILNVKVQAWATVNYYLEEVYPVLHTQGVIRIAAFANKLSMSVPPHTQFLRCLANYKALRFSSSISTLAKKVVSRMTDYSSKTDGQYVSVHLQFEEEVVASSCCVYDGGETEKVELDLLREKGWKGKFTRKDRVINPGVNRVNCPLTPLEVGMMLRGMGFDNNTSIYLASGKLYRGNTYLAPLLKMFPHIHTKDSLTTAEELEPLKEYSSRLAALDYMVCLYSEAFVTTHGGNFPQFMMGHRRFLYDGHAKTIKPDKSKLVLIMQDMSISWVDFKDQMQAMLVESDRVGIMVPRPRKFTKKASIYAFPLPDCSCLQKPQNSTLKAMNPSNHSQHPTF
ncbi:hypothetical protein QQ045_033396 [Rhodiola kirilowii]